MTSRIFRQFQKRFKPKKMGVTPPKLKMKEIEWRRKHYKMLMLMMQTQSLSGKNIGKDNKPKNNKIIVRKNDG